MKYVYTLGAALFVVPAVALAQFGAIDTFFQNVMTFVNGTLIPLIFAFALFFFIYGMFKFFIQGGDDEGNRETGRQLMIWSVLGFVFMVSIWGIVNLVAGGLQEGLGTNNSGPNSIPSGPGVRGGGGSGYTEPVTGPR